MRGFFGIGVCHFKTEENIGTLFRTAYNFGAAYTFTIGRKYRTQASDTVKSVKSVPYYHFTTVDDFINNIPMGCRLVGVEINDESKPIKNFVHPEQSCYILGSETMGIADSLLDQCYSIVELPGKHCHNVAVAGSLTMFDRINKGET